MRGQVTSAPPSASPKVGVVTFAAQEERRACHAGGRRVRAWHLHGPENGPLCQLGPAPQAPLRSLTAFSPARAPTSTSTTRSGASARRKASPSSTATWRTGTSSDPGPPPPHPSMLIPCPEGSALEDGEAPGHGAAPSPRKQGGAGRFSLPSAPPWGPGGEGCPLLPSRVEGHFLVNLFSFWKIFMNK